MDKSIFLRDVFASSHASRRAARRCTTNIFLVHLKCTVQPLERFIGTLFGPDIQFSCTALQRHVPGYNVQWMRTVICTIHFVLMQRLAKKQQHLLCQVSSVSTRPPSRFMQYKVKKVLTEITVYLKGDEKILLHSNKIGGI